MILSTFLTIAFIQEFFIAGSNAFDGPLRNFCFDNHQKGCDEDFVDVYKGLSRDNLNQLANTMWLLYTRKNPGEPEKLHKCGGNLPPNSNFNPNNKVIFLIPSFLSTFCEFRVYSDWVRELLKKEDANVIPLDYYWQGIEYSHENLKLIANQTIVLLNNIKERTGVEKLDITIIGLSLGAHLAGYIGRDYPDVNRIIGLDPAGPEFENSPPSERLSTNDATYVDVWHCNKGYLGTTKNIGHVNYVINGGSTQFGPCHIEKFDALLKGDIIYVLGTLAACSHIQCTKYFIGSINPGNCQFVGVKCDSYEYFEAGKCSSCLSDGRNCHIMGYDSEKVIGEIPQEPQVYYVNTALEEPYCDNSYVSLDGYTEVYESSFQGPPTYDIREERLSLPTIIRWISNSLRNIDFKYIFKH